MKELDELRDMLRLPQLRHRTLFDLPNSLFAHTHYLANIGLSEWLLALQAKSQPDHLPLARVEAL